MKNKEQIAAFWQAVKDKKNIFLTGSGGVGKSFLINQLRHSAEYGKICVTATTGIAAVNIGGATINSWSGMGTGPNPQDTFYKFFARLSCGERFHIKIKNVMFTDILVIDEISMMSKYTLDYLDYHLRKMKNVPKPFGGLQVIVVGDFFQLPPVNKDERTAGYAFEADSWAAAKFEMIELKEIWRQEDETFVGLLQRAREGNLTQVDVTALALRQIPPTEDVPRTFPVNAAADSYNQDKLAALPGSVEVFTARSTGNPTKVKYNLINNLITPETLLLKPGARVICTANTTCANGQEVYNGMLCTVVHVSDSAGRVAVIPDSARSSNADDDGDDDDDRKIWLTPYTWELTEDGQVTATFSQIPLKLAWALTIHKMQGATVDSLYVDMSRIFAPGQAYVALSRVRQLSGLYLQGFNQNRVVAAPVVQQYYANPGMYNNRPVTTCYEGDVQEVDMTQVPEEPKRSSDLPDWL